MCAVTYTHIHIPTSTPTLIITHTHTYANIFVNKYKLQLDLFCYSIDAILSTGYMCHCFFYKGLHIIGLLTSTRCSVIILITTNVYAGYSTVPVKHAAIIANNMAPNPHAASDNTLT